LHIKAAYTSFMNVCIQWPLRLPKVQDQKSLTHRWLSYSGWGRKRFSLVFDYKSGLYIRKGQRYTNVNILRLAIGYQNATMNRNTLIPEPVIGTDGSSQTWQTPQVDGYGSAFGPPRCSWSGFWMDLELNRTILAVRTRTAGRLPGPIANTRYDREYVVCHIGEVSVLWVCADMLVPPVSYFRYPLCTASLNYVGVVINENLINLRPGFWCFKQQIEMKPRRVQSACCVIASYRYRLSHIGRHVELFIIAGQII
jgi:hypothetical protein